MIWDKRHEVEQRWPGWAVLTFDYAVELEPERAWLQNACRQLGNRPHCVVDVAEGRKNNSDPDRIGSKNERTKMTETNTTLLGGPLSADAQREEAKRELAAMYSDPKSAEWIDDPKERQARADKFNQLQRAALGLTEEPSLPPDVADARARLDAFKALPRDLDWCKKALLSDNDPNHAAALKLWEQTLAKAYPPEAV